jgi:subtilisin family serine protease
MEEKPKSFRSQNYVRGSFVVSAQSSLKEQDIASIANNIGSELGCRTQKPEQILWEDKTGALPSDLANQFNVGFEGCDFSDPSTKAIVQKLADAPGILTAAPEALAQQLDVSENDPRKSSQRFLNTIRRDDACKRLGAAPGVKPVVVAVVDTGVDISHPDLKDALYRDANGQIIGANFVGSRARMPHNDNFRDGPTGHGTHVAGLIAATANNGEGGVGVASCAPVKIMPIRVLDNTGSGASIEIERGVRWAAENGADIINLSLGYTAELEAKQNKFSNALYQSLVDKNIIVFAAAGNDGYTNGDESDDETYQYHFPSSYDGVISVAATDNSGDLAEFSNRGDLVDIATPGTQLFSTFPGSYTSMSGTSMATPVAAGVYALALTAYRQGQPTGSLSYGKVESLLKNSIVAEMRLLESQVGAGGVLDASKLVGQIKDAATTIGGGGDRNLMQPSPSSPNPMRFVGLSEGARTGWPQELALESLPSGTTEIAFSWGGKLFARGSCGGVCGNGARHPSRWFFRGARALKAEALNSEGAVIGTTEITVRGY